MKSSVSFYLAKRGGSVRRYFPEVQNAAAVVPLLAIVIPCLNEYPGFLAVFASIEESFRIYAEKAVRGNAIERTDCGESFDRFRGVSGVAVITVVNNRESASLCEKENNREMLTALFALSASLAANGAPLSLIVIDCASPGRCIPETEGAGFARKTGMDYALTVLGKNAESGRALIACLDADTIVSPQYISVLLDFAGMPEPGKDAKMPDTKAAYCRAAETGPGRFASSLARGAVLEFLHTAGESAEAETVIRRYEWYLHEHSRLLHNAGSPYYPVALGPAIACTAAAYIAAGGMNCRCAGEDFYFLQSLIKTCSLFHLSAENSGALVFPSARISLRVPFGTGVKIRDVLEGRDVIELFDKSGYSVLGQWLALIKQYAVLCVERQNPFSEEILKTAGEILPALAEFLEKEDFPAVWEHLFVNNRKDSGRLLHAFHCWFDGLKTIRFFHLLGSFKPGKGVQIPGHN